MSRDSFPAREPVITVGSIGALVAALLTLLAAFGVPVSDEVRTAILGFIAIAAPIVAAVIARRWASPAWKVEDAYQRGLSESSTYSPDMSKTDTEIDMPPDSHVTYVEAHADDESVDGYTTELGHDNIPDIPRRAAEE